jgi:AraC-like DNA-binding protein
MKAHFEKVRSSDSSFLTFERADPEFPFLWHYHPEFELTLIVDSEGQRLVGDGIADYAPGDLVLLGPNLPHSWRSVPRRPGVRKLHRAVVVQFREDFLGDRIFALKEMEPVARLLKRSACGLAFGETKAGRESARKLSDFPALTPARRIVGLVSILLDLAGCSNLQTLSTSRILPMCRVEDQQRIDAICVYLSGHFEEEIDFTELSRHIHMDQTSLCRFFKRATGRTMTTYVNELRVGTAAQLLTDTDLSVLDIGFRVGFGNYSNFNRQFKKIKGYNPKALRKQFSSTEPPAPFRTPINPGANRLHKLVNSSEDTVDRSA